MTSPPPPEIIHVDERALACDGGEGALGHPRVYLRIGASGIAECPYCDRQYILAGGPADLRNAPAA